MKIKVKYILANIISWIPNNFLRVFFYNNLLGYSIEKHTHVGIFTVFAVNELSIGNGCKIGRNNTFRGPVTIEIGDRTEINHDNEFSVGYWVSEPSVIQQYKRVCKIGKEVLITNRHFFDIAGEIVIADRTWIAGRDSQFWTHGAGNLNRIILIGKDCYIGSAVKFAPGSIVGDSCIVGIGSVVVKAFTIPNQMLAGCPARIIKGKCDWKLSEQ
jgi:acetyltransferase-like isoleucine patch superfamily enzyme